MSIIDKLKKVVQKFEDVIQVPTYTLSDGTVVSIDKLEAGGVVMIGESPAPAGDHTLDDGTVITVGEDGVIATVSVPSAMETHTLLDGSSITVSSLEVGSTVTQNGEPAKEGDYVLVDGTTIHVDAEAKISSITPKAVEVEIDYKFETQEDFKTFVEKFADGAAPDINAIWAMVKALMQQCFGYQIAQEQSAQAIATYKQLFQEQSKKIDSLQGVLKEAFEVMEEIAKEPAQEPPTERKTRFQSFSNADAKKSQIDRIAAAKQKYSQLKNK